MVLSKKKKCTYLPGTTIFYKKYSVLSCNFLSAYNRCFTHPSTNLFFKVNKNTFLLCDWTKKIMYKKKNKIHNSHLSH